MTQNVGRLDSLIRFLLGLVLVMAPLANIPPIWSGAVVSFGSMIIGVVLLVTSFIKFCPLYRVLGLSTCKLQSK